MAAIYHTPKNASGYAVCASSSKGHRPPHLLGGGPVWIGLRLRGNSWSLSLRSLPSLLMPPSVGFPRPDSNTAQSTGGRLPQPTCMFTGIVEEMGTVLAVGPTPDNGFEMTVQAGITLQDVKLGDSISINGTCLTVTRFDSSSFSVGLAPETLRKTSLGEVSSGSLVNLERSLQPQSRMGGHFVQGHVDGTGTIVSMDKEGDSLWVKVKTSPDILRYIVPKGFIAIDGTSLTVVKVFDDEIAFNFMLVAYTQQKIVVPLKKVGGKVNIEVDILGKYVERLLTGYTTVA